MYKYTRCEHCFGWGTDLAKYIGSGKNFNVYQCPYCHDYTFDRPEWFIDISNSLFHRRKISLVIGKNKNESLEFLYWNLDIEYLAYIILLSYKEATKEELDENIIYSLLYFLDEALMQKVSYTSFKFITKSGIEEKFYINFFQFPKVIRVEFKESKISMILKFGLLDRIKLKLKYL